MTLPERFRLLRAHLKISARQMSARIGCSSSLWTQYELGLKEPSTETLRRLFGLGFDLHWVLTGEGQMLRASVELAPEDETDSESPLQSLLEKLGSLLDRYGGQTLLNLLDVVRVLEHSGEGMSVQQLQQALSEPQTRESVQQSLDQLQDEGIVVMSRGHFRLVRASANDSALTAELRTLVAIRDLLLMHYPIHKNAPFDGKLIRSELAVPRRQGRNRVRDLGQRVSSWLAAQSKAPISPEIDRIHVVLSCVVVEAPETSHE